MTSDSRWWAESWNPVTGCTPISESCENCYAERMARRLAGRCGYPAAPDHFKVTLHPDRLRQPTHWRNPRRIFVCSMGDLFHEEVPDEFIARVFSAMATDLLDPCKHTYIVLTKRPQRMREFIDTYMPEGTKPWPNVWLGVTAETQARADERIPVLLEIPAAVRFVSVEPMLGALYIERYFWLSGPSTAGPWRDALGRRRGGGGIGGQMLSRVRSGDIGWVICGAEQGPGARPMDLAWARHLRDECKDAGVPFFLKKLSDGARLLDGKEHNEWPR